MMTPNALQALAKTLTRHAPYTRGRALRVQLRPQDGDTAVVFTGGPHGDHQVWASVSDRARILAHWAGYCAAAGAAQPKSGDVVSFASASASSMGGRRLGRVLKVTPSTVELTFCFKYGRRTVQTVSRRDVFFVAQPAQQDGAQ